MKLERLIICGFVLLLMLSLIPVASAKAPFADFTGIPTYGTPPLTVQFTDQSTGSSTGWAWYFGDETYHEPWTLVTSSADWSKRYAQSSVMIPDGSIVLMGGREEGDILKNDVWRSTDIGSTWTQMTASAGWGMRSGHSSVAMPDGSIVLMGGREGPAVIRKNDVWRSTDNGATWTQMTANAGWTPREFHKTVAMPDGSIVLMGGYGNDYKNDVWRSTDNGTTWIQMTASAEWTPRYVHTSVAMPDGSIVLMGGSGSGYKNDVWRSTNNGETWTQMTPSAVWSARNHQSSVVMPDGTIVLMGGDDGNSLKNDVWRSTDNGATWTQVNASAGWSARFSPNSFAMPDGSIVLMGGGTDIVANSGYKNDVWRYQPAGSSAQNPSHTYATPGIYPVTLQVFNSDGYTRTIKKDYISVLESDYIITLRPGWNFISTPKMLETGYDTASIFKNVDTDGHSIWLYNAQVKQWTAMGASSRINPLDGIWVYSTRFIDIPLQFDKNPLNTPPAKQVYAGWNSIGFSDIYPVSAKSTLSSVKNGWSTIIGYNAATQGYEVSIINGDTGIHNDSREMIPTKGYWLGMMENGTLLAIGA